MTRRGGMRTTGKGAGRIVGLALAVALVAPILVLVGALGSKLGLMDWKFGFGVITRDWAPIAAMVGAGAGIVALLAASTDFRRLGPPALAALLIPVATFASFHLVGRHARQLPPIHDVSTDWSEPLGFSRAFMQQARAGADNPVQRDPRAPVKAGSPWSGRRVAEINAETCPGAKPVPHFVDSDRVREVLEGMGLTVFGAAPWRVEATAESTWFGFKDDVVVRIGPTRTDVRSISRVGVSDLGVNCKRVTEIVRRLNDLGPTQPARR